MIRRTGPAARAGDDTAPLTVTEAGPTELERWDDLTVVPPGGHVYQSRAFAAYRAAFGWRARFLVTSDGGAVLSLERSWPLVGGASAYVPRGPAPAAGPAATLAARLAAVAGHLARLGVDVIAADAEVEAASGYAAMLAADGFRQIDEIQPSRHRMDLRLGASADEAAVFGGLSATHRNLVRNAERQGLVVIRLDHPPGTAEGLPGLDPGDGFTLPGHGPEDRPEALIDRLHALVRSAGERRHFAVGSAAALRDWATRALAAGQLFLLEARMPEGEPIASAAFYRHGERLTYALAGDRVEHRRAHPGAVRLLVWRAIQVALREGRPIVDLGGVDVPGARGRPQPGQAAYGMLQFKEGFGAEWVELAGAHERVIRPGRYALGRVAARVVRGMGR
ncbi:MAG: putative methicillin resistance protein [Chloroflexi bacterium]|nr:putative methicillin resistance protein [Chloroflexota bacterium]